MEGPRIMVNGLPGAMALGCAEVALERGYTLCSIALAGSSDKELDLRTEYADIFGKFPADRCPKIRLVPKVNHGTAVEEAIVAAGGEDKMMVIDYTVPAAVRDNVTLYAKLGLSFVLGTTGFDGKPSELWDIVDKGKDGKCHAIIAPNMNKQIVAFQSMMQYGAEKFPGCFGGYSLKIKETHQKTKKDTSGTAKAVCGHMARMADAKFSVDDIERIRDDKRSTEEMGVPPTYLSGHAFHTYTFDSKDVHFEFQHNVCGRRSYCEGTVDALVWLMDVQKNSGSKKGGNTGSTRVFDMIDVLQG